MTTVCQAHRWLIRIGIVLPPLVTFFFVYEYGITIPYWDQWEFVPLLEKWHDQTLSLKDLWVLHNEHRIVFPKLLMLLLACLSGWNLSIELCANLLLALLILSFLLSLFDDTQPSENRPWFKAIISMMVFSMVQYENWSWGWQIQVWMSALGTVIAIWSANTWQGKVFGLLLSAFGAILASYSFGTGLATWPTVALMASLQRQWRYNLWTLWIVFGLAVLLLYYHQHSGSSLDIPMAYFLSHPILFTQYVLGYLGSPVAQNTSCASGAAIFMLILNGFSVLTIRRIQKERLKALMPWVAFIVYAVLSAGVTGVGRVGLGIEQAAASRYTTISILFVISTLVLFYHAILLNRIKNGRLVPRDRVLVVMIFLAFSTTYIKSYHHGILQMRQRDIQINGASIFLEKPDQASDKALKRVYPAPQVVRKRMKTLSDMGITFHRKN